MFESSSNALLVGLQIFGTLFIVLLAFLGMTAWIIRRVDRVMELVIDLSERTARLEGKIERAVRR